MRVAVVGAGDVASHPPSRARGRQLRAAGNRVVLRGHLQPRPWSAWRTRADVVCPATRGDVGLAVAVAGRGGAVAAPPAWDVPPAADVAWRAPADLALSSAPAGVGLGHHLAPASAAGPGHRPAPGRHRGRVVAVVARWTDTTPARWLADALDEAGATVLRLDALDHDAVPADADGVLVVESPLPALAVTGRRGTAPVLLWAHHGEHHTDTHVRLVHHYGADAVLLAHSWHLAHRFPRPVHRFPFGVPASLVDGGRPWPDRDLDVAFVGAGTDGHGTYRRRGALLGALRDALPPTRVAVEAGVPPERVRALYGRARLVPNDGGTKHRPVTMRVLEAVGAGAVLLTDDAPGLDRLLDPAAHHHLLDGGDVAAQVRDLLADPGALGRRAAAALAHARGHHTTAHRVDQLLEVCTATTRQAPLRARAVPVDPLLAAVDADLLLDDVLPLGVDDAEAQLADRVVWDEDRLDRLADRPLAHAVVVGAGWRGDPAVPARAARRVVVADPRQPDVVAAALAADPAARVRAQDAHAVVVDLGAAGYRVAS